MRLDDKVRTMRLIAIPFISALLLMPAEGQDQIIGKSDVRNVIAATTVTRKDGTIVNDLLPHQFMLFDNGKEQSIRVDQQVMPLSLVVCVQANANVEPVLKTIKKMGPLLEALVMGDTGEAAVVAFDGRVRVMEEFTRSGEKIQAALNQIKPGGGNSRMIDAVMQAVQMLKNRPIGNRRAILLISETQDKSSEAPLRQVLTALQLQPITVYTVNINRLIGKMLAKAPPPRESPIPLGAQHLPAGVAMTPQNAATFGGTSGNVLPVFAEIFKQVKYIFVDNPVEVFTKFTGGRERPFLTQKDLERVISEIGEEIHSQYMLSYTPGDNIKMEGGYHEIKVQIRDKPELVAKSRHGYWMAAIPTQ